MIYFDITISHFGECSYEGHLPFTCVLYVYWAWPPDSLICSLGALFSDCWTAAADGAGITETASGVFYLSIASTTSNTTSKGWPGLCILCWHHKTPQTGLNMCSDHSFGDWKSKTGGREGCIWKEGPCGMQDTTEVSGCTDHCMGTETEVNFQEKLGCMI